MLELEKTRDESMWVKRWLPYPRVDCLLWRLSDENGAKAIVQLQVRLSEQSEKSEESKHEWKNQGLPVD